MTTNVTAHELNYDHYATSRYDDEIVRTIPGHKEMHQCIDEIVQRDLAGRKLKILELGIGTGLTARLILDRLPDARYVGIDFSETMLEGARQRLEGYDVELIIGDYSKMLLPKENDAVVSVISVHHQETDEDKKELFRKIYDSLSKDGVFIFGDLVTYKDQEIADLNDALHYNHLVENIKDEQSLREWAYHHKSLNKLAALEDQVDWLKDAGFKKVEVVYTKFNTALLYAKK